MAQKTFYRYKRKRIVSPDGSVSYEKQREYTDTPRIVQPNPAPVSQPQHVTPQVVSQPVQKLQSKGTVKIGNVSLPINAVPNVEYVPENQYVVGMTDILEAMAVGVAQRKAVLLKGETGAGKTMLVNQLGFLTNNSVLQLNLNGNTTVDELVGRTVLKEHGTEFIEGVMIQAMRHGYWLLLDEINAGLPEVLLALQEVLLSGKYTLAEHNSEVVKAHPNFRVFATMNPPETYVGTSHLNPATLSRFKISVEVPYPDSALEFDIIKSKLPSMKRSTDSEIQETIRLATDIRNGYQQQEYSYIMSTRDLIAWHEVNEHYGNLIDSAKYTILGKCNADDRKALESIMKVYFSAPLEVRPEDGKVAQQYRKGQVFQVCDNKLELYDKRNSDFVGYAKSGTVIELVETKHGIPFGRILKGLVQPPQPKVNGINDPTQPALEPITLSHSEIVKIGNLSVSSTRSVVSK